MTELLFNKVAIVGLGLIGGSLAKVLKEQNLCHTIIGNSRSSETMSKALAMGMVDEINSDAQKAVQGCDLVVLAMPVSYTRTCLASIKKGLDADAIITDVGSVKGDVLAAVNEELGEGFPNFVAGHPIAGSEKSGVESGFAALFKDHKVILTPTESTNKEALNKIAVMWEKAEAEVLMMPASLHDQVLAATSHLPHLLAFALVDSLASAENNQDIFRYSAGGFRDFTRIASSDPRMWRDIFLSNKVETINALDAYVENLTKIRRAISEDDGDSLMGTFTRAKSARDHFVAMLNKKSYSSSENNIKNITYQPRPNCNVNGVVKVPGDKSISHRSIMLGSIAEGVTDVSGFLEGEDSLATLQAFRDMGVVIEGPENGRVKIHGVGLDGLRAAPGPIYVGNSGTSMRLLMGLLSGQAFDSELIGDSSLTKRPMERVAKPLREMGANIETDNGTAPVKILGGAQLKSIDYNMTVVSAQVKSALLLAGLYADGEVSVKELDVTRDHTERMLNGFAYPVNKKGLRATLTGRKNALKAQKIEVPGDISSAAFFIVASLISAESELLIKHVGVNPTRTGVITILRLMGAKIELLNERLVGGEPVADIKVGSSKLKGIDIPEAAVSLAIDEFPIIFIAAANAEGLTRLSNAEELRVKETDRISVMAEGLDKLGVKNTVKADGIEIVGGEYSGGIVNSGGDHRIAMAFAVSAIKAKGEVTIEDCANVATSFPSFAELAGGVGLVVNVRKTAE